MEATEELDRVKRQIRELEDIGVVARTPDQNNLLAGYLEKEARLTAGMPIHPFL